MPSPLQTLAGATLQFGVVVLVVAVFGAIIIQTIEDLGLRYAFQSSWIALWFDQRLTHVRYRAGLRDVLHALLFPNPKRLLSNSDSKAAWDELLRMFPAKTLFALPPSQLCGQISSVVHGLQSQGFGSAVIRVLLSEPGNMKRGEVPPNSAKSKTVKLGAVDSQRIERSIDDMQVFLTQRWKAFDYLGSFGLSALIVGLLSSSQSVLSEAGNPLSLYTGICATAAVLVPHIRPIFERLTRGRF